MEAHLPSIEEAISLASLDKKQATRWKLFIQDSSHNYEAEQLHCSAQRPYNDDENGHFHFRNVEIWMQIGLRAQAGSTRQGVVPGLG